MKRIAVGLCFIISMSINARLLAQNTDDKNNELKQRVQHTLVDADTIPVHKWTNLIERFIGVWSLEETDIDDEGKENTHYPGIFMIVHPNAAYTIFVHTKNGAVITSKGSLIIESSDEYVEVISHHINSSLMGVSNRIDYKIDSSRMYKSFWLVKDKKGNDFNQQINETWKRAVIPEVVF